jgi:hypothetical protein
MKHTFIQRTLAFCLALCIVLVGGLASAQSVSHESQHAHHQKATHSSILCSWMCAAGQTHDASFSMFEHELNVLDYLEPFEFLFHHEIASTLLSTRAPPQLLA